MLRILSNLVLLAVLVGTANATQYYMAPAGGGGSDANNGLSSGAPWLTPNHALNCNTDQISAVAGTYAASSFGFGQWGTVTCSGHGVAWIICATFDACKISNNAGPDMVITTSHWGIAGFEGTQTTSGADNYPCFDVYPLGGTTITDFIFANDIANGCRGGGFHPSGNGHAGVDYFVVIASIAYNAAQEASQCASGIPINFPANFDSLPGTHIYVSQNFMWANVNPNPCAGGTPTDGEGIIFDTFNWDTPTIYTGQSVMENNISLYNGASGYRTVLMVQNKAIIRNNTGYGDASSTLLNSGECGEFALQQTFNTEVYNKLALTKTATGCGANPIWPYFVDGSSNSTDIVYRNQGLGVGGNNSHFDAGTIGPGNLFTTSPSFASPPGSAPAAPSCGSASSVINCTASLAANFVSASAPTWGYQPPTTPTVQTYDPVYPQWLCNGITPTVLSGLITQHCVIPDRYLASAPTNLLAIVH